MWIRKFKLELEGKGISRTITDLRIDFTSHKFINLKSDNSAANDYCEISIWNLSPKSIAAMKSSEELKVKLLVGYEDDKTLSVAFEGFVKNTVDVRQLPNTVTTLYAIPNGRFKGESDISYTGTKDDTLKDVLAALCDLVGMKANFSPAISTELLALKYRNKTVAGVGIHRIIVLAIESGIGVTISDDAINFIPLLESRKVTSFPFSKVTPKVLRTALIRGQMNSGTGTLNIPYACDFSLTAGDILDMTKLDNDGLSTILPSGISNVSGIPIKALHQDSTILEQAIYEFYQIKTITHTGSNYTPVFISHLSCVQALRGTRG